MSKKYNNLPQHIAIIMDGNRRWARQHGLEIFKGHEKVVKEVTQELVDHCLDLKIPYLTLWAFSTENWKRDKKEVDAILNLFRELIVEGKKAFEGRDIRINAMGDLSRFPLDIQKGIEKWMEETKNNQTLTATFALNYGGHDELVRAVRKLVKDLSESGLVEPKNITAKAIEERLDTANLPNPDLIIRPGREVRLSGFMSWQSAYAELYFTDVLMPDFGPKELDKALQDYAERERRFGG